MSRPNKTELIDMAINMLEQAKESIESLEKIREKLDQYYDTSKSDALWARHCYQMIRAGVGVIEVSTAEITDLSHRDIYKEYQDEWRTGILLFRIYNYGHDDLHIFHIASRIAMAIRNLLHRFNTETKKGS